MATPYFRDGRTYPTHGQILAAVSEFDALAAKGLALNDIADALEVTRGSVCVIARWSRECAAGLVPSVEVRLCVGAAREREYRNWFQSVHALKGKPLVVPENIERREVHEPCFACGVAGGCRHRPWMLQA